MRFRGNENYILNIRAIQGITVMLAVSFFFLYVPAPPTNSAAIAEVHLNTGSSFLAIETHRQTDRQREGK